MSNNTTCLVIGADGYVGSAMVQTARDSGWHVTGVGRNNYTQYVGQRFNMVINANGNASRFKANREPAWDFNASVRSVYESLFDFQCDRYAMISTVDVYNEPANANATAEDTPIDPARLCSYGFHKRLAELCVIKQAPQWQIFRLAQMVGANLKKGPLFDVLERKRLWIHPQTRLHYMNTRNVGHTVVDMMQHAPVNEIYNVCGRDNVAFDKILELFEPPYSDVTYNDTQQQTYCINTDKTHRLCPLPGSLDQVHDFINKAMAQRNR
jgi:nucleoside-diphosphate-sugar epimerase